MEPVEEVDGLPLIRPPLRVDGERPPIRHAPPAPRRARRRAARVARLRRLHVGDHVAAVQQRVNEHRRRLVRAAPSRASAKSSSEAMFVDAQVTTGSRRACRADARCTWPATTRSTCGLALRAARRARRAGPRGSPISSSHGRPIRIGGWCMATIVGTSGSNCAASHSTSSEPSSRPGSTCRTRRSARPRLRHVLCRTPSRSWFPAAVWTGSAAARATPRRARARRVAGVRDVAGHQHGHRRGPERRAPARTAARQRRAATRRHPAGYAGR